MAKSEKDDKQTGYEEAGPRNKRKPDEKFNPSRLSNIADDNEQDPVTHKYKQDNFKDVKRNDNPG